MIEEDSLISQNDIDKLLESSSIEEVEGEFANDDDLADELGELSQDDIDNLMNSNLPDPDNSAEQLNKLDEQDTADPEDGEMELISQDDIDQLMNSNVTSNKDTETGSEEEDFGELSQTDIDRLMNPGPVSDEKELSALDDDEDFEEFSKDDIKALMKTQDSKPERENLPEDMSMDNLNLEEDILVNEKIEKPRSPVGKSREKEDDFVINEAQAVGVADCLISQITMDELIRNFNTAPASDPVILDEEPQDELKSTIPPEQNEFKMPIDVSPDGTEDFLKPVSDVDVLELNDDREDVSQEDIDALLSEPDEEEDDILISQDDIDTLLMAADQEDEDVLGDLMEKGSGSDLDDMIFDEDILEKGVAEEAAEEEEAEEAEDEENEENEDQVVLQGDDEVVVKPKKKKIKAGSPWYKKKLVLVSAAFLVILGIIVPVAYFLIPSGEQKAPEVVNVPQAPEKNTQMPEKNTQREVEIETVETTVNPPVEDKKPGNMVLKDFVILSPDSSKSMTYITADISIDYADQKAFKEIQNKLPYFRDLIYDSISKSLVVEKQETITEAEILSVVEMTLKKALPANFISRVSFISFKIS